MLDVEVKKSEWMRGQGALPSYLLDMFGMRCCVGFLARVLGVEDKELQLCKTLSSINIQTQQATKFQNHNYINLSDAYRTNDDQSIDDEERMKQLKQLGNRMDVNFTFVD